MFALNWLHMWILVHAMTAYQERLLATEAATDMIRATDDGDRRAQRQFDFPPILPRLRMYLPHHVIAWSKIRLFLQVSISKDL